MKKLRGLDETKPASFGFKVYQFNDELRVGWTDDRTHGRHCHTLDDPRLWIYSWNGGFWNGRLCEDLPPWPRIERGPTTIVFHVWFEQNSVDVEVNGCSVGRVHFEGLPDKIWPIVCLDDKNDRVAIFKP